MLHQEPEVKIKIVSSAPHSPGRGHNLVPSLPDLGVPPGAHYGVASWGLMAVSVWVCGISSNLETWGGWWLQDGGVRSTGVGGSVESVWKQYGLENKTDCALLGEKGATSS